MGQKPTSVRSLPAIFALLDRFRRIGAMNLAIRSLPTVLTLGHGTDGVTTRNSKAGLGMSVTLQYRAVNGVIILAMPAGMNARSGIFSITLKYQRSKFATRQFDDLTYLSCVYYTQEVRTYQLQALHWQPPR